MQEASSFQIRTAKAEERPAVADLTVAAYAQYATKMPAQAWQFYRQNITDTVMGSAVKRDAADASAARSLASRGDNAEDAFELIVAKRDGALVGSVLYTSSKGDAPESAYIRLLAVAPEGRGQGIGKALTRECLRRARAAGATSMLLHTTDLMYVAQSMYLHMGFVRAPEFDFRPSRDPASNSGDVLIKGYRLNLT